MFSALVSLALLVGLTDDLRGDRDWQTRERAERDARIQLRFVPAALAWTALRNVAAHSSDPEQRLRLQRLIAPLTVVVADELLPPWVAYWPSIDIIARYQIEPKHWVFRAEMLNRGTELEEKAQDILVAWAKANEKWNDNPGWGGGLGHVNEYPDWWSDLRLHERDAARQWAIQTLGRTGDIIAVQTVLIAACEDEIDHAPMYGFVHDTGGFKFEAYQTVLIYDTNLLNRKYFDGRRRNQGDAYVYINRSPAARLLDPTAGGK